MKNLILLHCIFYMQVGIVLMPQNILDNEFYDWKTNFIHNQEDTIWKVKPIARLNDPAPGGGNFEEFAGGYFLNSGYFIFWGRHGKSERKDWSLYSFKNGELKLAFNTFEKITQPDGIPKEFHYIPHPTLTFFQASNKFLYLSGGDGAMGQFENVYSFNGEQFQRIIAENDKIKLSGNREATVKAVRLETITNDGQAVIFFVSEKPNKIKGWLLHDGTNLKQLFIVDDELPGMQGVKIKGLVINGTWRDKIFIFNDTILANLYVENAPSRQGIFRISKSGAELIESAKGLNPVALPYAGTGDNFIIKSKEIFHYKNGNREFILEGIKDLPKKEQFSENYILTYGIAGPEEESIVFAVAGNSTRLFLYREKKLTLLTPDTKSSVFDLSTSPVLTKSLIALAEWAQLKTNGPERFDVLDVIAKNENKLIVRHRPFFSIAGFFELTK